MVFFPADQQSRAFDLVGKILLHRLCQHLKSMACDFGISLLIPVIGHHDSMHELSSAGCLCNAFGAGLQQSFPGIMPIDRFHSLQQPDFNGSDIFPLQRRGINGDKSFQLLREQLDISLPHISPHRLTDYDRLIKSFPCQYFIQPPGFVHQIEIERKRP